jgi:two-component system alkaline phosphatase synthesis response regulator PhoP
MADVTQRRVLVVEDDPDIVELVSHYLAAEGFTLESSSDGREALARLETGTYQLLVLDLQLPGMDGLTLLSELRRRPATRGLPVVMLTARGDLADRVVGLELGADDYIVKPFSPKELVARVRALFRRIDERHPPEAASLLIGAVEIDRERHTVKREGRSVHLTAKEFALLLALADARGRVLTRQALIERIWGYSYADGTRTVDVHVRRLREKLPELAPLLVTVKSLGYRLATEAE